MNGIRVIAMLMLAAAAGPALAQLGVPGVPGVQLPGLPVLQDRLPETLRTAQSVPLAELRRLRIQELLRSNRKELETDPDGQLMVRNQLGALAPSDEALARARQAGYRIISDQTLEGIGLRLVVLETPRGVSTRRALKKLRNIDPGGSYDYNHIYMDSGVALQDPSRPVTPAASIAPAARRTPTARIGLIDSGVDGAHAALAGTEIRRFGCEGGNFPAAHGTAVASIMVGSSGDFRGVEPGARLYAADIFCGQPAGASIGRLALALDWMARERVPVINISLVGAQSVLLTGLVRVMGRRGYLMVAAVGNDGPASPPLYPAAYPEVVGVTAVDARQKVLPEACRGRQVAFAAPGADMRAAGLGGTWAAVRGTSFASPIVAGLLAAGMMEPDPERARLALERISALAVDLGPKGVDTDYGKGLVGADLRIPL